LEGWPSCPKLEKPESFPVRDYFETLAEGLDVEAETFLAFLCVFFTLAVVVVFTWLLPASAFIEVVSEVVFPTEAPVATEVSAAKTKLLEALNKAIKAIANKFFMVFLLKFGRIKNELCPTLLIGR
jgi:hypothetical protein